MRLRAIVTPTVGALCPFGKARFTSSAIDNASASGKFPDVRLTETHGHVRFCPAIGGQADITTSSDRLGLLGIPVHPASLIRLAGATFMILGVVLIRT